MRAFRSEWIKLSTRTTLLGFAGAMIGFCLLFTTLVFVDVGGGNVDLAGGQAEPFVTAAMLSRPEGAVFALTNVSTFLGVIALALFAANLAGEFSKGTLRTLFVAEPDRVKVFAGKIAALTSFTALAIAISTGVAGFILGEALVGVFWDTLLEWGPAAVSNALAVGGAGGAGMMGESAPVIAYTTAALLAAGYATLSAVICSTVLSKRDVTS